MIVLRYLTLAASVVAMLWPAAPPRAAGGLAGTRWAVVEVGGKPAQAPGLLQFEEARISGRAPCNGFFASYSERGGKLQIGSVGATRRMCQEMEAEREMLGALSRVTGYQRDGARLVLVDDAGNSVLALVPAR